MTFSREALTLARYESCVFDNPRKPGEGAMTYIARVAEIAAGLELAVPGKDMPEVRLPYADR